MLSQSAAHARDCDWIARSRDNLSPLIQTLGMILRATRRLERSGNELDRLAEVAGLLKPNALVQGPVGDASLKGLFVILLSLESQSNDGHGRVNDTLAPSSRSTGSTCLLAWPLDKAKTRDYLQAYFDITSRITFVFLHKPTILADWGRGILDTNLLKCLVAFGLFLSNGPTEAQATARAWMREVQDETIQRIGRYTITHLRILVLLSSFCLHAGDFGHAWNILALAARVAFTMRLNYEHDRRDPIVQESHRRLIWAIYHQDRLFSGGIADFQVCPVEKMHVRLPCDDRSFEMGLMSKAGFLKDDDIDPSANMDTHAFKLRLLAIRDRILRSAYE